MTYYRTKNLYLAELGIVEYDEEEEVYTCGSDDESNGYTFVYYKSGEMAKDAFSNTKYCVFDRTYPLYRYKGTNTVVNLYSVTSLMDVPSDYVSINEMVNILNREDPYRRNKIKRQKYGVKNFHIEAIEETSIPEERE